jgi:hypothetical protein
MVGRRPRRQTITLDAGPVTDVAATIAATAVTTTTTTEDV